MTLPTTSPGTAAAICPRTSTPTALAPMQFISTLLRLWPGTSNNPTYLQTHAHIQYWESWNEWYRNNVVNTTPPVFYSVRATYAQMVRMTEDFTLHRHRDGFREWCSLHRHSGRYHRKDRVPL